VNAYLTMDGTENLKNMIKYMCNEILGTKFNVEPVKNMPWEGLFHPDAKKEYFSNIDEYLEWYKSFKSEFNNKPKVGIIIYRSYWIVKNNDVPNALIKEFEKQGIGVIPIFSYGVKDVKLGNKSTGEIIKEWLMKDNKPIVDAIIDFHFFFLSTTRESGKDIGEKKNAEGGVEILKSLDIPVFTPINSFYRTEEEWRKDGHGIGTEIQWSVVMPEFEGRIEPIIVGALSNEDREKHVPIEGRIEKVVNRIKKWIELGRKPVSERKVAFMFNNNPCASVEATVGGAAHLDSLESVARILQKMKERGYNVNPPKNGKELIDEIMNRKAISEFRWTTVDEIVKKGGAVYLMPKEEYIQYFNKLKPEVQKKLIEAWGNPPGEKTNNIPPAMVYDGKIVITGVNYGNAMVCIEPKSGCAGPRCDGVVCKILHDPDVLPPHQYLATHWYVEYIFKADVIVQVGTHARREFLPGKSVGLSESCMPDLNIGNLPLLYIYNSDNPSEGTIAKRRTYAVLVDHMQTVMTESGVYKEMEELERNLAAYNQAKATNNGAKMDALKNIILENIKKANLDKEIKLEKIDTEKEFEKVVEKGEEVLHRIRNTQIQDGMHIFGEIPTKEKRIEFINGIMRYDSGSESNISLRRVIFEMMNLNYDEAMENPAKYIKEFGKTYGELLADADKYAKQFIGEFLQIN